MIKDAKNILSQIDKVHLIVDERFNNCSKGAPKVCSLLFRQMQDLSHSIILLIESNHFNGARILARSLIEVSAYTLYISDKDCEDRTNLYQHSRSLSGKVAVDDFNRCLTEEFPKADTTYFVKAEQEAIKYFNKKYGKDESLDLKAIKKKYALNHRKAASQLQGDIKEMFDVLYSMFYRRVSALSHGEDLLAYFQKKSDETDINKKQLKYIEVCAVLRTICRLHYLVLKNLDRLLQFKNPDLLNPIFAKIETL